MEQFNITGMSCAACSSRIEKAVSKVSGVTSCSVSLLTNSMGVEGTASNAEIIAAVQNAGYGASEKVSGNKNTPVSGASCTATHRQEEDALADRETPRLLKRLLSSILFLIVLMYFSMGHMMWGWPLPHFFDNNHVAMGLVQLLLAAAVMVINQKFFVSGFSSLLHGAPNMDTLVALGSAASFVYSTAMLFIMTAAVVAGDEAKVMECMHEFYFESAAMILTLITVGKMLESHSKGKTTDALKSLMRLAPKTATVIREGKESVIPIEELLCGDIFVVRPGENIPVDGIVIEGNTAVNEAAITGESIPVDKAEGSKVTSATTNLSGFIKCRATRVGEDTTLSQIIQMVSDAAATKAPAQKIADKVSGIFVPVVIAIAAITTIVWILCGAAFGFALARGISVLVISCPCALGLATPVAIMVGNGVGARNGILFKTAASLEEAGKAKIIAFDKTGTITKGEPRVTDIIPAAGVSEDELLQSALDIESKSEHPLSKAILAKTAELNMSAREVGAFKALAGSGLSASDSDGNWLIAGSVTFVGEKIPLEENFIRRTQELSEQGKTPLLFACIKNGAGSDGGQKKLLGAVAVADVIKEDSAEAISELRQMGIKTVMITGDNERTAAAISKEAGVDQVIAGVLPNQKADEINSLKKQGKTIMVGDGINDAPALTAADTGIAIGAGTDIALDAADIVLMKSALSDVVTAVRLSRATLRNIHENLFWAFIYNVLGIPLAAGAWIWLLGWKMNPMFGAAAMSLSSFCVVTNALRLNLFKAKKSAEKNHQEDKMEKTVKIEGMMCEHCEARVKKALEAVDGVTSATASHKKGTAVITTSKKVDQAALKAAVEAQDYKFLGIA